VENKSQFLNRVGKKIKMVRKLRGISQEKLSEKLTIRANALSKIEIGERDFHIMTLKSIADALKVDVKDFL